MLIAYVRCSTAEQDPALQLDALGKVGVEKVFTETASGTRTDRPELRAALEFAREGDVIVVYSLSRLARSIRHLLDLADELAKRGIGLRSITEAIDTTTAQGRFLFTVLAAMNEMEVDLLRERTRAGLRASRARGRVGGRPPALDAVKLKMAKTLMAEGTLTAAEIARQLGCAPSTLYRSLPGGRRAMAKAA